MLDLCPHVYGKGSRLYFETLEAAKLRAKELAIEHRNKGVEAIDFPTELRLEAAACHALLKPHDLFATPTPEPRPVGALDLPTYQQRPSRWPPKTSTSARRPGKCPGRCGLIFTLRGALHAMPRIVNLLARLLAPGPK